MGAVYIFRRFDVFKKPIIEDGRKDNREISATIGGTNAFAERSFSEFFKTSQRIYI